MGFAEEVQAKADAEVERLQGEADEHTMRLHFVGSPPRLRNDSPAHSNTLTSDEHEAVKLLADGKRIPKKALDKNHSHLLKNGGSVAVAQAVARCV